MKWWMIFVVFNALFWGAYAPFIHVGQDAIGGRSRSLWAFLFVGLAYFLVAVLIPGVVLYVRGDLTGLPPFRGWSMSLLAGAVGAGGALCLILAILSGGKPIYVAPLVFAGAPIVNTFISMAMHKPQSTPNPMFFVGILIAAVGASLVLYYKPN